LEVLHLFGEAERIAARAASASTRRQYAAIFRAFAFGWLAGGLGRQPIVGDLNTDAIAAYGRHLAVSGGRGGRPAAPATLRAYISMVRALVRSLGREDHVDGVRVPRHEPGPPETLTDTDCAYLLRVPERRKRAGKRDYGLLRALGDRCVRMCNAKLSLSKETSQLAVGATSWTMAPSSGDHLRVAGSICSSPAQAYVAPDDLAGLELILRGVGDPEQGGHEHRASLSGEVGPAPLPGPPSGTRHPSLTIRAELGPTSSPTPWAVRADAGLLALPSRAARRPEFRSSLDVIDAKTCF
jgi:hypothetical protein